MSNKKDKKHKKQLLRNKYLISSKNIYRFLYSTKKTIEIFLNDDKDTLIKGKIIGGSKNTIIIKDENEQDIKIVYLFSVKFISFEKDKSLKSVQIYDISKSINNTSEYLDSGTLFNKIIENNSSVIIYFKDATKIFTTISSIGKYDIVSDYQESIHIYQIAKIMYIKIDDINSLNEYNYE